MRTLANPSDRAELVRRLRRLRPDQPRRWGRMTPHQMVCHLADAFRMAFGEVAVTPDSGFFRRTLVKWVALSAPVPWPAGIGTSPEIDQAAGRGTRPGDFAADVATVEAWIERARTTPRDGRPPHPIFGRLSESDWLRWGWLHVDHHLRQFGA
jgi:hypothetical protein